MRWAKWADLSNGEGYHEIDEVAYNMSVEYGVDEAEILAHLSQYDTGTGPKGKLSFPEFWSAWWVGKAAAKKVMQIIVVNNFKSNFFRLSESTNTLSSIILSLSNTSSTSVALLTTTVTW